MMNRNVNEIMRMTVITILSKIQWPVYLKLRRNLDVNLTVFGYVEEWIFIEFKGAIFIASSNRQESD